MTLYTAKTTPNADPRADVHRRRDPDPIEELATIDDTSQDNNPDRPNLSIANGPQPGFGPDGTGEPEFSGNPELGIDPREAAARLGNGD